ncbi:MAG: phasin family protein [Gammaproteobacteria bacterium]|uniref:phasin family protein n=1 Tax=Rhodoferax sp. TaxID=50421 RepID=UPI0017E56934|nr:phasin family protein [Rhodoferax sp.]MBU3898597.1 phasin family protein [Gammaproteobacteria bacterium]MBA3057423.1 phasin family protein [Rhodoferax sp.]MBU3997700.1 phasin family protein [Gammaproteobacteria bacterium]MBU4019506.1 phasin family protein [Gammaproteobacteria bacterium]MBU4079020.1 phasin family protein [Gammaproteobacteria bacterium]
MTHSTTSHAAPKLSGSATLQELTKNSTQGFEKLLQLNMAATQAFFGPFQALMGAKNAQSLRELQTELLAPLPNKYAAESQHYQLLAEDSSAKLNKMFQSKLMQAQKNISTLVDNVSSAAPVGTQAASAFLKNALTASQNAIQSAQHSASQALQQTESSLTRVTTQTIEAAGKAFQQEAAPQPRARKGQAL